MSDRDATGYGAASGEGDDEGTPGIPPDEDLGRPLDALPHPLDRLWMHPSELAAVPAAQSAPSRARPMWTATLMAGAAGAILTLGVLGAVGALDRPASKTAGTIVPTSTPVATAEAVQMGNTKLLGIEVYTKYLFPLQIAAVLLLVAIIAAIALTLRHRKDSRFLDPAAQLGEFGEVRDIGDRYRLIPEPALNLCQSCRLLKWKGHKHLVNLPGANHGNEFISTLNQRHSLGFLVRLSVPHEVRPDHRKTEVTIPLQFMH